MKDADLFLSQKKLERGMLLTVDEVAAVINVSRRTVLRREKEWGLARIEIPPRHVRYDADSVMCLINSGRVNSLVIQPQPSLQPVPGGAQ